MKRMRLLAIAAFAIAVSALGVARSQEAPPAGPSPEMKKLEYMVGKRTVKGKMYVPGQPATDWTGTDQAVWGPGSHSIRCEAVVDYGGGFKDTSLIMMSYDAGEKLYKMYRFSSLEPAATEASGKFEGEKLVMMIKPDATGQIYRITYTPKSTTEYVFVLEHKTGENFGKFLEGVYTR
jgi:hypothetical protein